MSIFSCACLSFICLLWRNVYLGLLPIFHFIFLYRTVWYWTVCIFWTLSPCQSHNFQSLPFCRLSFHFVYGFLVWLGLICLFLPLFLLLWETDLRKHGCNLFQRMFCLCSPLGVLCCHASYFKFLSYFEFIFTYGVRECSISLFHMWLSSFPNITSWRDCHFSMYILAFFVED